MFYIHLRFLYTIKTYFADFTYYIHKYRVLLNNIVLTTNSGKMNSDLSACISM